MPRAVSLSPGSVCSHAPLADRDGTEPVLIRQQPAQQSRILGHLTRRGRLDRDQFGVRLDGEGVKDRQQAHERYSVTPPEVTSSRPTLVPLTLATPHPRDECSRSRDRRCATRPTRNAPARAGTGAIGSTPGRSRRRAGTQRCRRGRLCARTTAMSIRSAGTEPEDPIYPTAARPEARMTCTSPAGYPASQQAGSRPGKRDARFLPP